MMRAVWLFLGILSLILGLVGAVLPLLPTVPFLLLAAFCFARSSAKLHHWLTNHPRLGPPIADWTARGAIGTNAKRWATASIAAAFGLSVLMDLRVELLAVQATVLLGVLTFIWTRPSA